MRLVPKVADGGAGRLADLHGGRAKVAPAEVGQLAGLAADEVDPALDGVDGLHEPVLCDEAAKVVAEEVAGGVVDVEAVGYGVAVEGEGRAVHGEG